MAKRALVERAVKSLQAMHAAGQHQRNAVAARALGPSGIAAPPTPPMPDVREPRVEGGAASLSTRTKPRDQPPLYPGMRCALKPEFIDMEHLRRQATVSEKTHYRGLPHKYNLAVPMLRKWVVHQMGMIPRQKFARMSSKAVSAKVSGLTHPASKWYQWLCLNIELEKAELVSLSTRHMGVMNRKNASASKMEMGSAGFSASSMKSHCHEIGSYILDG